MLIRVSFCLPVVPHGVETIPQPAGHVVGRFTGRRHHYRRVEDVSRPIGADGALLEQYRRSDEPAFGTHVLFGSRRTQSCRQLRKVRVRVRNEVQQRPGKMVEIGSRRRPAVGIPAGRHGSSGQSSARK